ncbi:MAG: hypothetical protein ABRQ38_26665 [Candidatus Eremiobacterota bacterium]|mgnify:CR=1 FL=1|jgi:predicted amidophosphoribosyltransferase
MEQLSFLPQLTYAERCMEHAKIYAFCRFCGKHYKRARGVKGECFCKPEHKEKYEKEWERV